MNTKEIDSKESNSNEELVKREDVKNTPFQIIEINGEYFGAMGQYRITETYRTKKEIKEEIKKITWNRIIQVMMLVIETQKK